MVPEVVTRGSSSTLLGGVMFCSWKWGMGPHFMDILTGENEVSIPFWDVMVIYPLVN